MEILSEWGIEMSKCNSCGGITVFISGNIAKCEYCGKMYSVANGVLSDANLAQIYETAVAKTRSQNEQTLQQAIELFEALGSYKDSAMKAIECRDSIRKQKVQEEDRKLEERRQAEKEEIEREKRAHQEKK